MEPSTIVQKLIRPAHEDDLTACAQLDLTYETDYVWQMDVRDDAGAIAVSFRTVRLPRPMRVIPPHSTESVALAFAERDYFLVAETAGVVRGYLTMRIDTPSGNAWVTEIGVGRAWRRQQLGTALLGEAYTLAKTHHATRLIVEMQTKNYAGICFCQQLGLTFCGFNDRYYASYDIALFFGQPIR